MINFCLSEEEKNLLKNLVGKRLIKYRHDPLEKFGNETVYGRVELFFEDSIIMIDYDYAPYPLFDSEDDDHPKFSIKMISEQEAISALQDVTQINIICNEVVSGIMLVEDDAEIEWEGKKDNFRCLKAIVLQFANDELAIQGDYMMPLLDLIKGENVSSKLTKPGDEFMNDPETKFKVERFFVRVD